MPPIAIKDKTGAPLLSWRVGLLPYLGEEELYKRFNFNEPWNGKNNTLLLEAIPKVYQHPQFIEEKSRGLTVFLGVTKTGEYLGDNFHLNKLSLEKIKGMDKIIVIEAKNPVPWTKPLDFIFADDFPLPPLGTRPDGAFHALFTDLHSALIHPDSPLIQQMFGSFDFR